MHHTQRREEGHTLEKIERRVGRHNLQAAGAGRTLGEGEDRTAHHKELGPEVERTRMVGWVVVRVGSLVGDIGPEVGGRRKGRLDRDSLDRDSCSWLKIEGGYSALIDPKPRSRNVPSLCLCLSPPATFICSNSLVISLNQDILIDLMSRCQ